MEQGGTMLARRARPGQFRMDAQQRAKRVRVSRDDGVDRSFEMRDYRIAASRGFEMGGELRPTGEAVRLRYEELSIRQQASGRARLTFEIPLPIPDKTRGFILEIAFERRSAETSESLKPMRC